MQCYAHPDAAAQATCTDCDQAVCTACIRRVGSALYCAADYAIARYDPKELNMQQQSNSSQQKVARYLAANQARHKPQPSVAQDYRPHPVLLKRPVRHQDTVTSHGSIDPLVLIGCVLCILLFMLVIFMIAPLILAIIQLPQQMT